MLFTTLTDDATSSALSGTPHVSILMLKELLSTSLTFNVTVAIVAGALTPFKDARLMLLKPAGAEGLTIASSLSMLVQVTPF